MHKRRGRASARGRGNEKERAAAALVSAPDKPARATRRNFARYRDYAERFRGLDCRRLYRCLRLNFRPCSSSITITGGGRRERKRESDTHVYLGAYGAAKISKRNSSIRRARAADPGPSPRPAPQSFCRSPALLRRRKRETRDKITPKYPALAPARRGARKSERASERARAVCERVSISWRAEWSAGRRDAHSLFLARCLCPGRAGERWGSLAAFNPSLSC